MTENAAKGGVSSSDIDSLSPDVSVGQVLQEIATRYPTFTECLYGKPPSRPWVLVKFAPTGEEECRQTYVSAGSWADLLEKIRATDLLADSLPAWSAKGGG
jgi:hypothetical protein